MKELDAIILKMEPGDILVLQAKGCLSDDTAQRIKAKVEDEYGVRCMVLGDDLQLKVLRPALAAHAH
jgi:hypothetical protein